MSSGRTPGFERKTAVGPPGAAWSSAKTTTEMRSSSGRAWPGGGEWRALDGLQGRIASLGFELPLVHVPEAPALVGLPLKPWSVAGTASSLVTL